MLYIIRHGQTVKNRSDRLQGRADDPLNEQGIAQSEAVGKWFEEQGIRFDVIYSSPLSRAIDTAKIAAGEDIPVVLDDRLIEMDYGPYEGMDMRNPAPEIITFFSDFVHNPAPDGMEQLSDVVKRLGTFVEEIREAAAEKNILVSTHAIAMKGALEYLTPLSGGSYWSKYVGNCSVYVSEILEDGSYAVPHEIYAMDDFRK